MNLTVIAAGAWGTALAIVFSARHRVTLWTREDEVTQTMLTERENRQFFPGYRLPDALLIATDFATAVRGADLLIMATPLAGFRVTLRQLVDIQQIKPLLWVCKGMEADSASLPHQIVAEELGADVACGVLTGPSFAEEVARGLPTAITLAASNPEFARQTALALHSARLRIYASDDVIGAEVGAQTQIERHFCDEADMRVNSALRFSGRARGVHQHHRGVGRHHGVRCIVATIGT